MRFKLDENLPVEAAEFLRSAGHDARTVLEQGMGGRQNPESWIVEDERIRVR